LVSPYAHIFVLLCVVIVTLPLSFYYIAVNSVHCVFYPVVCHSGYAPRISDLFRRWRHRCLEAIPRLVVTQINSIDLDCV